jgi:hypothetical protein
VYECRVPLEPPHPASNQSTASGVFAKGLPGTNTIRSHYGIIMIFLARLSPWQFIPTRYTPGGVRFPLESDPSHSVL